MKSWTISGNKVRARVDALGAMVGPAYFDAQGGCVQPFAVAPWWSDDGPEHDALPGILKAMRGEWPCVPFGMPAPPRNLPIAWAASGHSPYGDPHPHGFAANVEWNLVAYSEDAVTLSVNYPADHPIKRLSRSVRVDPCLATLHLTLQIEARTDCEIPIGLHPTFALADRLRETRLSFAEAARCWTMPVAVEPGVSKLICGQRDVPLSAVALENGGDEDLSVLPLPYDTEEIVLVTNPGGYARLDIGGEAAHSVVLRWDDRVLPTCQLWISNRGRTAYPWNGRFLALGVEPLAAAFDLGVDVSTRPDNPLRLAGIATTRALRPDRPLAIEYSISVEPHLTGGRSTGGGDASSDRRVEGVAASI